MPRFMQTVAVYYDVIVEAEDEYTADEKVRGLTRKEILNSDIGDIDTQYSDEMPYELP